VTQVETANSEAKPSPKEIRSRIASWLRQGWQDLWIRPGLSLAYGPAITLASWEIILGLVSFDLAAYLLPSVSAFLILGPILALGLYDKSRRIDNGTPLSFSNILRIPVSAITQLLLAGTLLTLLLMLWVPAAAILYALFFGLQPFPGVENLAIILFATIDGWALLVIGSLVGGLFASLAFPLSVFAIPMLYDQETDVLTAMAISLNSVSHEMGTMISWGIVVVALGALCLATGLVGLIVIYPLLGHATWRAYRDMCDLSKLN
jgi:uncharacterized membrane protein